MSEERIAELERNLRSVTDQVGRLVDIVQQKGFVPVFRCGHSRLFLPADFLNGWGTLYGIGLGPDPVSDILDTDYTTAPPDITPDIQTIDQIMHPVYHCRAQLDFMLVAPEEYAGKKAVLETEDRKLHKRARIVRAKQLANPAGRLRVMQAKWEKF